MKEIKFARKLKHEKIIFNLPTQLETKSVSNLGAFILRIIKNPGFNYHRFHVVFTANGTEQFCEDLYKRLIELKSIIGYSNRLSVILELGADLPTDRFLK